MVKNYSGEVICEGITDVILWKRVCLENDSSLEIISLREIIKQKVNYFIVKNIPIEFSMSAFSLKAQIPWKCISSLPDMAEYEALLSFDNLAKEIEKIYNPWTAINIFADGRIFVWLLYLFTDELVTSFIQNLKGLANQINDKSINITSLEDVFWNDFEKTRESLFSENYVDIEKMIEEMQKTKYWKNLITYIRDFYAKDIRKPLWLSIRESKIEWLEMAIWVLSASKSWWSVIWEMTDENCIRLSCHQRPYIYEPWKIWIYMNNSNIKCWMPWHWVALKTSEGIVYKKLEDVIKMWAVLVENNWLPYYSETA